MRFNQIINEAPPWEPQDYGMDPKRPVVLSDEGKIVHFGEKWRVYYPAEIKKKLGRAYDIVSSEEEAIKKLEQEKKKYIRQIQKMRSIAGAAGVGNDPVGIKDVRIKDVSKDGKITVQWVYLAPKNDPKTKTTRILADPAKKLTTYENVDELFASIERKIKRYVLACQNAMSVIDKDTLEYKDWENALKQNYAWEKRLFAASKLSSQLTGNLSKAVINIKGHIVKFSTKTTPAIAAATGAILAYVYKWQQLQNGYDKIYLADLTTMYTRDEAWKKFTQANNIALATNVIGSLVVAITAHAATSSQKQNLNRILDELKKSKDFKRIGMLIIILSGAGLAYAAMWIAQKEIVDLLIEEMKTEATEAIQRQSVKVIGEEIPGLNNPWDANPKELQSYEELKKLINDGVKLMSDEDVKKLNDELDKIP